MGRRQQEAGKIPATASAPGGAVELEEEEEDGLYSLLCRVNALATGEGQRQQDVPMSWGAAEIVQAAPGQANAGSPQGDETAAVQPHPTGPDQCAPNPPSTHNNVDDAVPPSGRNNVVDAGPLLRRLQEQLAETRRRQAAKGATGTLPAAAPGSLRALAPSQRRQRDRLDSSQRSPSSPPPMPMAQALCHRLLSLKFEKVMAFALSLHAMRSAYQSR